MNDELLNLIRRKTPYVIQIRDSKDYIEVKIPCAYEDISWIRLEQCTTDCEKIVKNWIFLGGNIENETDYKRE